MIVTEKNNKHKDNVSVEQMSIVVIGHVDHGKSTVIGRLLADTGSLPEGRMDDVRAQCVRNARPFEYAFLLDALKDEQAQGITIDSARCFFRSSKRNYIIIDAPGHIEFLKNMISGAARAEAAVLVIDAKEGVQENSRRHGYLLSMLGIRQVAVLVNKMDLVDYDQGVFEDIRQEYTEFLAKVDIEPDFFLPVSARNGDNIALKSAKLYWFKGPTVLGALDDFVKEPAPVDYALRFPVQDIYKFTAKMDDRRIIAGRIETGSVHVGDSVVFLPSGKRSAIATIEGFNMPHQSEAIAGQSIGVTLTEQVYVRPGEIMTHSDQVQAQTATQLRVNIFWMGSQPMIRNKRYQLKLAADKVSVWLGEIVNGLDASDLTTDSNRSQIQKHDVAECVLETVKPIAFDLVRDIAGTGRFVIIDNYTIAGGGVVLGSVVSATNRLTERVAQREKNWQRSVITCANRALRYNQKATLVVITGAAAQGKQDLAKALEEKLFVKGRLVYYLGLSNSLLDSETDIETVGQRDECLRRLGEISHMFTDAGLILITTISGMDDYELNMVKTLNQPNDHLVVNVGISYLGLENVDLQLDQLDDIAEAASEIECLLANRKYLVEYYL